MLRVFFGTDTVGVRQKAYEHAVALEEKGISVVRMTPEAWSPGGIADAAGSTSLFGPPQAYLIDTPSESKEFFTFVFDNLDLLAESGNTFILIEGALLAAQKKKLQKHAESAEEITGGKHERFNTFRMTDALLQKDKKTLWLLLTQALREGIAIEEIIGVIFWQVKLLRLAAQTNSAHEAGQKDFPYNKAKRALKNFTPEEVDTYSRELVSIYHDGHQGIRDIGIALERWILEL